MKKNLSLLLFMLSLNSYAQDAVVEKSMFGIQAGYPGAWLNNELRLSRIISLRTEAGLVFSSRKDFNRSPSTGITPVLTVEPRYYYNLNRRRERERTTANNSGDYFTVRLSYSMYQFYNNRPGEGLNNLFIIPMWGIRRSYGNHFNFESGAGLGQAYYFNNTSANQIRNLLVADLQLRVGYKF